MKIDANYTRKQLENFKDRDAQQITIDSGDGIKLTVSMKTAMDLQPNIFSNAKITNVI